MLTPVPPADDRPIDDAAPKSFLRAVFDDRIVTVPNLLTVVRLACVPLFLYLLFGLEEKVAAAGLLAVLGATDWFDGKVARRYDQVSELGKLLDPAADRILLITAVVAITVDGGVPLWFALPIMIREPIMFAAVVALGALGAKRIDVTWFGKAGTFALMVAFPLFLVGNSDASWADAAEVVAWLTGIPGLALSLYATVLYVPMARRALAEGRAERAAQAG
jgi:cardiolipin synthase